MYRTFIALGFGAVVGLACLPLSPAIAHEPIAQSDATNYCNRLYANYVRWLPDNSYGQSKGASVNTEIMVALTLCNNGRADEAIPILETALIDARFKLPEKAIGARRE